MPKVLTTSSGESHTVKEWAKKIGIPEATLRTRMRDGWTVDEAVGLVNRHRSNTIAGLAKQHGISPHVVSQRLRAGWNLEEALNKPLRKTLTASSGETHSVAEWAKKLGINEQTLWTRIRKGWEVDRILGGLERSSQYAELAMEHGIPLSTLRQRLERGIPLEEAIAKPARRTLTASNGETHTISAWAKKLGVPKKTIQNRATRGWEPDEILGFVKRPASRNKGE